MNLREIIEAKKVVSAYGRWQEGSIPKAEFPLKKKKLSQSKEWLWRIVRFNAMGQQFAVLIRLNEGKQEYHAVLAHVRNEGLAVICHHDLHVSHKNWHCHFVKGDVIRTNVGYLRDRDNLVVFPNGHGELPCSVPFDVTRANALGKPATRYRFDPPSQGEIGI